MPHGGLSWRDARYSRHGGHSQGSVTGDALHWIKELPATQGRLLSAPPAPQGPCEVPWVAGASWARWDKRSVWDGQGRMGQHGRGWGSTGEDRRGRGGIGWDGTQQPPPLESGSTVGTAAGSLAEALLGEPPHLLQLCLQGSQRRTVQLQGGQGVSLGHQPHFKGCCCP